MKKITLLIVFLSAALFVFHSCQKDAIEKVLEGPQHLPEVPFDYNEMRFSVINGLHFLRLNFDTNDVEGGFSNEKATLGRVLFYDKRLSKNNAISCGSCHEQKKAFADGEQFSFGLNLEQTSRNSMSIGNTAYHNFFFWDGRARNLRTQVMMPIQNHIEMGIEKIEYLVDKLDRVEYLKPLFESAYGSPEITEDKISIALAQFIGSMVTNNSKFDQGLNSGFDNFTQKEKDGVDLFFQKFNCDNCHTSPLFTNSWRKANVGLDIENFDEGDGWNRFKVPSLRNIELTAPYMHDGRFRTLEEVIEHYNSGIQPNPSLDWSLRGVGGEPKRFEMTNYEKNALIAFLKTLTDEEFINDERFSDPF